MAVGWIEYGSAGLAGSSCRGCLIVNVLVAGGRSTIAGRWRLICGPVYRSRAPGRAPLSGCQGRVVWMRVPGASAPGRGAVAAQRAPAAPDQLVEDLYRGHALRLTRMALLLVGDRASVEDVV